MSSKENAFLNQLRATFKVEAADHLQTLTSGLLNLEKSLPAERQVSLIASVFRAAHSLKGAARAVDFNDIESTCQMLENLFASWQRQPSASSPIDPDMSRRALHAIDSISAALEASDGSPPAAPQLRDSAVVAPDHPAQVAPSVVCCKETDTKSSPKAAAASHLDRIVSLSEYKIPGAKETVRIRVSKLDARLIEAEEMLTTKLITGQRVEDLRELGQRFEAWHKEWSAVEPETLGLRQAMNQPMSDRIIGPHNLGLARLLDFFDWNRDQLKMLENKVATLTRTAQQDCHVVGKLVDDLLEDSKKLLLLPFRTLSAPLPKLVRDLCNDLGKEADLVIHGEDVEMDKRILEEMKDPLIHLLRNCVDHGVETSEMRVRAGKPARATITLAVSQVSGSTVEIVVSDDGAGIDVAKVKKSAVKCGLLPLDGAHSLSDREANDLIFRADVSTSPIITHVSGRGLGMAIVHEQAEKLGGTVSVESQHGTGARFHIVLPSMRATFRGVLIGVEGRIFVLPTVYIERVARVNIADVQTVEGRETIPLGGRAISLVRLADVLGLPTADASGDPPVALAVLVLGLGEQRIAFAVDSVLDEQEVLVKPFCKPLSRVRNIAAATILGSGRVAPVLHVPDLLKSARNAGYVTTNQKKAERPAQVMAKSILAVDDSATSRMLIKGMLESAGYKVITAVDGLEAFALLRSEKFDILVSDVEMPRLNGFDLVARIRADKKLTELPVVLVTARESREDRERGIDVGANAYIIKSNLDQSNLLDAVRRLV